MRAGKRFAAASLGLRVKPISQRSLPAGQALSLTTPGTIVWANPLSAPLPHPSVASAGRPTISLYCRLPPPFSNYPGLLVGDVMRLFRAAAVRPQAAGFRVLPLSSTLTLKPDLSSCLRASSLAGQLLLLNHSKLHRPLWRCGNTRDRPPSPCLARNTTPSRSPAAP